jgi:hypothetical protein
MNSIREWAAHRYRRLKAFARSEAPYLILIAFLLLFFVLFFFGRIVIAIQPGELGALAVPGRRHADRHRVPRRRSRDPAV